MRIVAALALVMLVACASDSGAPSSTTASLDEPGDFQSLSVGIDGGPCPTEPCGESILLKKDGTLVLVSKGRRFEGALAEADRLRLTGLAGSADVFEELQKVPGCPGVIHGTMNAVLEAVPGIYVNGDISGCNTGALAALRYQLITATKALFPETQAHPGQLAGYPASVRLLRVRATVTFDGFSFLRRALQCAPPASCAESLTVYPRDGLVLQLGGSQRGEFRGVTDFEPLSSVAIRKDVVTELRKPAPCVVITDLSETMNLEIGSRMWLRADSAGCNSGPIGDLRAAAKALVARLAGMPASDAGTADHPSDLRPP